PLKRFEVRTLEVSERFGARLANRVVLILLLDDFGLAFGLDVGQLELLAENRSQLVEADIDFQKVPAAGVAAGLAAAVLRIAALGDRLAFVAVALADATGAVVAEAEMGHVELRHGDRD